MPSSRPSFRAAAFLAVLLAGRSPATADSTALPFGPGERVAMRVTYAGMLAGRASLAVEPGRDGASLRFVSVARSQGFFAWLFRFHVDDRTVAEWDPATSCSLGIEKHLREGRAAREQVVRMDPDSGRVEVEDRKMEQHDFSLQPCVLDVLSAFFLTRARGVSEQAPLKLPVFDNGKSYLLEVRWRGRERLDLPEPLGRDVPTVVVEPLLAEGTGLFATKGRVAVWLTDDERRIPVRLRSKVAIGSISADLESYTPPAPR